MNPLHESKFEENSIDFTKSQKRSSLTPAFLNSQDDISPSLNASSAFPPPPSVLTSSHLAPGKSTGKGLSTFITLDRTSYLAGDRLTGRLELDYDGSGGKSLDMGVIEMGVWGVEGLLNCFLPLFKSPISYPLVFYSLAG